MNQKYMHKGGWVFFFAHPFDVCQWKLGKTQTMVHTTKVVCGLTFSSQSISQIPKKSFQSVWWYWKVWCLFYKVMSFEVITVITFSEIVSDWNWIQEFVRYTTKFAIIFILHFKIKWSWNTIFRALKLPKIFVLIKICY